MVLMFFSQVLVPCLDLDLQLTHFNKTASAAIINDLSSSGGEETDCMEVVFQSRGSHKDELLFFSMLASVSPVELPESSNFSLSAKENSQSVNSLVLSAPVFLSHRILRI